MSLFLESHRDKNKEIHMTTVMILLVYITSKENLRKKLSCLMASYAIKSVVRTNYQHCALFSPPPRPII